MVETTYSKRILWADSLKGWLILLVILGHAIQSSLVNDCFDNHLWNLIYSFHMPAFMAVSGWFAYRCNRNRGGYLTACKRRCYQVLVPYFVWSLLRWILCGCHPDMVALIITNPDSYFWFLWVIFWICAIFIGCQWIADKLKIDELIPVGVACVVLLGAMVALEFRLYGFQFLSYYFFFYTLGYCIHRFELLQLKNNFIIGAFTVIWVFLAWGWTMHGLPSWMPYIPHVPIALLQYAYRGLAALIGVMVLIGFAPKVMNGNSRFNCWMKNLGEVSLGLYVVHLILMDFIVSWVQEIKPNISTWYCVTTAFAIVLVISYMVVYVLYKNKITARFFLGKLK